MNEITDKPLVSVIIPTYNYGKYIGAALESVFKQTYDNFEIIIIDNYSNDDTEEIVNRYDLRKIKYFKKRNNGVLAISRNSGIKISKGIVLAFLDADDTWMETKLEEQILHLRNKEIIGVGSDALIASETPYYRQLNFGISKYHFNDYEYEDIIADNPVKISSAVVRRDIFDKVGGFDEDPRLSCIDDYELWLRMSRFGKFRILGKKLISYRKHYDQDRKYLDIAKNLYLITDKHVKLGYLNNEKIVNESISTASMSVGYYYLFSRSYEGKNYYRDAFKKTSKLGKKIKSLTGYFLSLQPPVSRNLMNILAHKLDRIILFFYEKIKKFK